MKTSQLFSKKYIFYETNEIVDVDLDTLPLVVNGDSLLLRIFSQEKNFL